MYQVAWGSTHGLADVEQFIEERLGRSESVAARLFDPLKEVFVARAPGRLDLMGGIADYSGSLVLQLPLAEAAIVGLQPDSSRVVTVVSMTRGGDSRRFSMPLSDFMVEGEPLGYDAARSYFKHEAADQWPAYVAGAFLVLMRERGARFQQGARMLIDSGVPEGRGVSSSAALEAASMQAIATAFGIDIAPRDLALLCQKVENLVVGAPCGVMDQMAVVCGEVGRLLALLCQPAQVQGNLAIHGDAAVWGLDSGVRHYVSGGDYTSVRVGTFMGYRMICEMAGIRSRKAGGLVEMEDKRWRGYLANVTPAEFEAEFAKKLPEQISGSDFVARYGGITDPVTRIEPGRVYAVRAPAAHPIYEHARVRAFAAALRERPNDTQLEQLGELMYQSHESYSACGLGSEGTDLLVKLVRQYGPARGLFGAKITGGGSGGTVAVLGHRGSEEAVRAVAADYERRTGHPPYIFSGSSPGSAAFGALTLRRRL